MSQRNSNGLSENYTYNEIECSTKEYETTQIVNSQECKQPIPLTDLHLKLQEGLRAIALGNTRPFTEAIAGVKVKRSK